jgi:hypothetical protein
LRVAVEVAGWEARQGPRERTQRLGAERWRVLWFAGQEVHADVDRCVADVLRWVPRTDDRLQARPRPPLPRRPVPRSGYRERR